eukprot:3488468-Rhodomonas_salina.1
MKTDSPPKSGAVASRRSERAGLGLGVACALPLLPGPVPAACVRAALWRRGRGWLPPPPSPRRRHPPKHSPHRCRGSRGAVRALRLPAAAGAHVQGCGQHSRCGREDVERGEEREQPPPRPRRLRLVLLVEELDVGQHPQAGARGQQHGEGVEHHGEEAVDDHDQGEDEGEDGEEEAEDGALAHGEEVEGGEGGVGAREESVPHPPTPLAPLLPALLLSLLQQGVLGGGAVSYTHLTLPTICSV